MEYIGYILGKVWWVILLAVMVASAWGCKRAGSGDLPDIDDVPRYVETPDESKITK
jgi:hypothetical protein